MVGKSLKNSLEERASGLIHEVQKSPNSKIMLEKLKEGHIYGFFRMSLLDEEGYVLYDSHEEQFVDDHSREYADHIEVEQALREGIGYSEEYSHRFLQPFAYVAKAFEFQGERYVLRTAFPLKEIKRITDETKLGFLTLGALVLLLYSLMTWAIIHRLSSPIQQIINKIKPYQEGFDEFIPKIELNSSISSKDDFERLAGTLNSMSEKIQKQIEVLTNQRNETQAILDSLVEGIVAIDHDKNVTYANEMACRILGLSQKMIINANFLELNKEYSSLIVKCQELVYSSEREGKVLRESQVLGETRKIYIDIIAIPVENGALLVLQDKSSDHKVVQVGKDFIANASHELRTPITIILGFAETLQDLPEVSPKMLEEITSKMIRTCERLNHLVKNLLTLADIENVGASNLKEIDSTSFLENSRHMVLELHKDAKISINQKRNIHFFADPGLLELALINLLENAVKYSDDSPNISIDVDQNQRGIQIDVKDQGMGIPEHDLEHVFERFYTVDKARSRRKGGAGLGLSIVKTIIEKHGGKIDVSSVAGKGTEFHIILPPLKLPQ